MGVSFVNEYDVCLKVAEQEAKRFLERAKAFRKRGTEDPHMKYGTKESGALHRASLDLTRALAELRRPLR